jgi:mannose-6-phosphate isomerase-like protein (cupin superfamily)
LDPVHAIEDLSRLVRHLLGSLDAPKMAPFLALWLQDVPCREAPVPASLPVLKWLPDAHSVDGFAADLLGRFCAAARDLAWRQTYGRDDIDAKFLDNYGYTELLGPHAPLPNPHLAGGFLLLGPHTHYPRHRHEATEIYVPLSGTARWQQGDGAFRELPPGRVVYHESEESHAMQTGGEPLLALYLWRSTHLEQKARLICE